MSFDVIDDCDWWLSLMTVIDVTDVINVIDDCV